jgi:hypothetical protein
MVNLDAMFPDELEEAVPVFESLANYARAKAKAMRERASGDIQGALQLEGICEDIYRHLPEWAKW